LRVGDLLNESALARLLKELVSLLLLLECWLDWESGAVKGANVAPLGGDAHTAGC